MGIHFIGLKMTVHICLDTNDQTNEIVVVNVVGKAGYREYQI